MGCVVALVGLVLLLVGFGVKTIRVYWALRSGMDRLSALQDSLHRPAEEMLNDFDSLKEQVEALNSDVATLRAETRFLDPVLGGMGWVPRYGPELTAIPHLTAMAAHIGDAGVSLTGALAAVLPALEDEPGNLAQAIDDLQAQHPLLHQALQRLQRAAYERTFIEAGRLDDGPFARMAPFLDSLDAALPGMVRLLSLLDVFLPRADSLLGMDAPRRYLILGQSNFELRATGGFLGSMGVVTVDRGEIAALDYRRSYDWDDPDREKVEPPRPYVRYMDFGAWYIRDANWYADFPTSAQTIEWFWGLDGHDPVEGVIAVDLYAVESLIEVIGPVDVPGHGISVAGGDVLETIWGAYRQDPGFLSALVAAVMARLQQPGLITPESLPSLLLALDRSLQEKHILLYFDDPALQEAVVEAGWGGAIRDEPGDYLMVVDSDFSYAEVTRFVEQEIQYNVAFDHSLSVLESTVTLSYWNHFDRWQRGGSNEPFGGGCFNPQTGELEYSPGCYGNYIRLYVPEGSRFVSAEGFDDGMEYRDETGRTVIAGYLRILPGEQRTVSVTYVPPTSLVDGAYHLTVQKQPGTDALPVDIEVQVTGSDPAEAGLYTDLRIDRAITAVWEGGHLVLSSEGAAATQIDPERRARQQAFDEGLVSWRNGRRDEALARWRGAGTADLVLDRANLLLSRGNLDEAEALCRAALEISPDLARAHFLLGKACLEQGDAEGARQAWESAVALEPENRSARLELGLLYESQGDTEQAYTHLLQAEQREANQALWERVWPYFNAGRDQAGLAALDLIIRLNPGDVNALLVLGNHLRSLKRYDEALAAYAQAQKASPQDVRLLIGRGQVYADQGQGEAALSELERAVVLAPRSAEAWFYLGQFRWKYRQDAAGAIGALEEAVALYPNAWYATVLGNVHRDTGDLAGAVAAYELAVTLPGHAAYTWATLGRAYGEQERWEQAVRAYIEAVKLEPGNASLHATLADAYEKAGEREKAIAEYEAALTLQPGQEAWQRALERLR